MWKALISFLLLFTQPWCISADGTYECGDHGRFEYCIDEIPGCVIGCHCHPGYYFDTDTKICEPNSKLIKQHRRDNIVKSAEEQKSYVTPNVIYDAESAFGDKKIDNQVDEIAKDANDLGDWLYNQFFKTIENQVINNTNDKDVLTRRSGSKQPIKTPKRSKKWNKRRKSSKQKGKKKQLRRKLLRITENDSLFDLSSKSSSDSSDSSSSSDLSSMEYEVDENNHHEHEDDQHGHKKIVMINKKPKQPLPSFIFLPNLDTPFYPPIGLPPPPIVPMHPMIPVPPVPMYVISVSQDNTTAGTNTTSTTVPTITSDQPSLPETTAVNAFSTDAPKTTDIPETDRKALRLKNKRKKKKATRLLNDDGMDIEQGINNLNYIDRQKILQRLQEKMSNPSVNLSMPSWKKNKKVFVNKFVNQNTDVEIPFLDNRIVNDESNNKIKSKKMREDETFSDNVDFKYITELIHRVDLNNKSKDLPPIEYNPLDSIEYYQSPSIHEKYYGVPFGTPDARRTNRPMYHKPDESYYANLGRQIAKMIRGKDTQNVDLKEMPTKINNDPYLSNSPTSFWERSVRSPLAYLETKNKKYEFLKKSNELLFDIENKVEIIASTAPALSLQEIENIVKIMEAAKREIQRKKKPNMRNSRLANKNLNIDLWPQKSHNSKNSYKNSVLSYLNQIKQDNNISNYKTNNKNIVRPDGNFTGFRHSIEQFIGWNNENLKEENRTHNISTSAKPAIMKNYLKTTSYNSRRPNIIHQILARASPLSQNTIKQTFQNQQINPYFMPRRKYFQDNYNNYYVNQNEELPRRSPVVRYNWSSRHIFLK